MSSKKYRSLMIQSSKKYRVPEGLTLSVVHEVLSSLNCPRSLAVWIIIRDDPSQLKALGFDPLNYENHVALRDAYTATKILSKSSFLQTGIKKDQVAISKFLEMESRCKITNRRFGKLSSDPNYHGPNVTLLSAMQRKIESILVGYSPEELFGLANWGPGATTRLNGLEASASNKFQCETGITRDLYYLISPCLNEGYPLWAGHLKQIGFPTFEVGNKVVTVPKDAFTDRVIAIEPGINIWFQKAIGSMIRSRLLVHGINLNTQGRNQQLAKVASKTNHLATVDFSSASDSISKKLIEEVFPPHWYALLNSSRSHFGRLDGQLFSWEKFSSMGNGFTFELESLIFYAAAFCVCKYLKLSTEDISVYGDDVIIPVEAFELYSSFCDFLGFTVNEEKSFSSGSQFRESCGSHYSEGYDVTPVFVKNALTSLYELYILANQIRWLAHRRVGFLHCDLTLKPAWLTLFTAVPKNLRIFVPYGKGDGGFIGNFDEALPVVAGDGIEGYHFWQFIHVGITRRSEGVGLMMDRLWNTSFQEYGNNYTLRGRTRVSFTRTLVSQWYSLGSWL